MIFSKYSGGALALTVFLPMMLSGQRIPQNNVPLKNWATPLYWQPNQAEREGGGRATPQLQFSANAVSTNALTFVAITPCRLVDTRGATAGFVGVTPFNGPSIAASGTATFPVEAVSQTSTTAPAPCGTIPTIAQAYSVNLTVVPTGGGRVDYVTIWPSSSVQPFVSTLDDPQGLIVSNAAIVPAGTSNGAVSVFNAGPVSTDVIIDMNGYYAAPTDVNLNTAIGAQSLSVNSTGIDNTATGYQALQLNTSGGENTASGAQALQNNTTGASNTGSGFTALQANTTGRWNSALGANALQTNTTGNFNTADGVDALQLNTTGSQNTAIGVDALDFNTTGGGNIAIGYQAAFNVSNGNSNNIHIGNLGLVGDSGAIKIGTAATQTAFFAAGIRGVTTGSNDAVAVVIDSNGQLGTVSSSQRFKEDIQDMGEASSGLLSLRPVTFRYKQPFADGSKPVEYGLIAEEVAKVYPDLVAHSADGQIETVKYQVLDSMLLNELQKQSAQIHSQDEEIQTQNALIRTLEARLAALESQR